MERIPSLRLVSAGAAVGLATVALAVFLRRLGGMPLRSLAAGEAAVYTALFAITVTAALRHLAGDHGINRPTAAALLLTLAFIAGLSAEPVTVLVCTGVATAFVTLNAIPFGRDGARQVGDDPADARSETNVAPFATAGTAEEDRDVEESEEAVVRFLRTSAGDGEHLDGSIRFAIPPGETATTLHVPLWPPLPAEPVVRCRLDGIDGRVRVPYSKPHGFRVEVKLPEPVDEPLSGVLRFSAECRSGSAAA